MKTILISGIGGPTPRSVAKVIRAKNSDIKLIGIDANRKAIGFYMKNLADKCYVAPKVTDSSYFSFIKNLINKHRIDYAFIQPEKEIITWGDYFDKHGKYPCPVLIPPKALALTLVDKALMAEILEGTEFIPKTIRVTQQNPEFEKLKRQIGFPCWIRATQGSGGFGSLKLQNMRSYKSWLMIHSDIEEFTISEFLPGRHLANQMLYYNDEYIKGASLECVEYVMASISPSKVTGNTSFGRFLNANEILRFSDKCVRYICKKLGVKAHGVLSFDLKEDSAGNMKVTEVNIRHMAYTGILAKVGFDLISDSMNILENGHCNHIVKTPFFHYDKPYIFLRDVDIEPIILESEDKLLYEII